MTMTQKNIHTLIHRYQGVINAATSAANIAARAQLNSTGHENLESELKKTLEQLADAHSIEMSVSDIIPSLANDISDKVVSPLLDPGNGTSDHVNVQLMELVPHLEEWIRMLKKHAKIIETYPRTKLKLCENLERYLDANNLGEPKISPDVNRRKKK